MTTVIPQSELTKRAIDWISEHKFATDTPAGRSKALEEAAVRFNLGPLDVEFLDRFFKGDASNG